jgi:uncharacterized protein (DUF58 family)
MLSAVIPPRRTAGVIPPRSRSSLPPLPVLPPPILPPIPVDKDPVPPLDLALLHDLPSLELRARCLMDGFITGMHRSPQKGFSVEFAEYRPYQLGDDLRRIDWRLYGRSDRLNVKQYEQETQLRVFLVLDTSASMAYASRPEAWLRKIDFARTLLAAVGLLALRQCDAFGLAVIGADLDDYLRPKASKSHWRTALGRMDALQTGGPTGLAKGLGTLAELLPRRSLVVIASDFYEESAALNAALRRLRFDRQEIVAFHTLDPMEIGLHEDWNGTFIDSETGQKLILDAVAVRRGYVERFQQFLAQTQASILNHAGDYSLLRTDANPMEALGHYLGRRERLC